MSCTDVDLDGRQDEHWHRQPSITIGPHFYIAFFIDAVVNVNVLFTFLSHGRFKTNITLRGWIIMAHEEAGFRR